ncbi:hypothetical protein Q1695_015609 [Nippostrongylus brasiliensis]|nr:hypothetical protein Q1695_015609 [Nippostrongylus brasiliensis]
MTRRAVAVFVDALPAGHPPAPPHHLTSLLDRPSLPSIAAVRRESATALPIDQHPTFFGQQHHIGSLSTPLEPTSSSCLFPSTTTPMT